MASLKLSFQFILSSFLLLINQSDGKLLFTEEPSNPTYVAKGGEARLCWKYECTRPGGCAKELYVALWHSRNVIFVEMEINPFQTKILLHDMGRFSPSAFGNGISPKERNRYIERVSLSNNNTLVISGVTEEDLKIKYTCTLVATAGDNYQLSSQVNLKLAVPPRIRNSSQPKLQELHEGQAKLSCETDGEPEPIITWIKDGTVIKNSTNATTLLVRDKGTYECRASNMAGNYTYQITVVDRITSGDATPTSGTVSNGATTKAKKSSDDGVIVAAIVAPLLFLCLVVGIALWIFCRKKKERRATRTSKKRLSELVDSKYEAIHMDDYKSPRDKSSQQSPLENGYMKVNRNIPNSSDNNQNESVNKDLPESVAYASVERKFPQETLYASVDKKTPQVNSRPLDEYAQVDMSKKKNKKTPRVNNRPLDEYAQVDMSKKKNKKTPQVNNRPLDEYAQVDMSKKKKKRKPGELLYAELDIADSSDITSSGESKPKPSAEPTMYAEVQFEKNNPNEKLLEDANTA